MSAAGTPPGWYADPWVSGGVRWWDGQAWTSHAARPGGQPTWVAPVDVARLVESEAEAARWARIGVWAQAAWAVIGAIALAVVVREMWDFIQEVADQPAGSDLEEPVPSFPPGVFLFQLLSIVQLGALVAWIVWQHRANTAAQALGLRLTRSPGWGVGGWFIPIVNLWFPYEAARDNLPDGHPTRPIVLHWWLAWLAQGVVLWVVAIAWVAGGAPIGLVGSLAQIAFACWWATRAERVLASVLAEHRRLVSLRTGVASA